MGFGIVEIDLTRPLAPIEAMPGEDGIGLVVRWNDRLVGFEMIDLQEGPVVPVEALAALLDERLAARVLAAKVEDELRQRAGHEAPALPRLSVAICTKDRAARLSRLLSSIERLRYRPPFHSLEILVVDNAATDTATREAVQMFDNVRYFYEPKAGLNFARNAALAHAKGEIIAYLDDDVVVDRNWLAGLAKAYGDDPAAGGWTGLVLPFRLDTEAQICFERRGGFGRGFSRTEFRGARFENPLHPVGAGMLGAGCNMTFDHSLLLRLGGFDEALDTGAPLPGGGDLDIFYRVLRSGRTMAYEPEYAVYHEHRETMPQLRRQYWSWGLGMMAFLAKSHRADEELRPKHRALVRWWLLDQLRGLARALRRRSVRELRFGLAELRGGIMGLAGEYRRSCARVKAIREQNP